MIDYPKIRQSPIRLFLTLTMQRGSPFLAHAFLNRVKILVNAYGVADRYCWVIMAVLCATHIVVFMHRLGIGLLASFIKEYLTSTDTQNRF